MEKFHINDEKLIDYILGEVSEQEKVEIERQIAGSKELETQVNELKESIGLLSKSMKSEVTEYSLDSKQTEEILNQANNPISKGSFVKKFLAFSIPAAAAMFVLVGLVNEEVKVELVDIPKDLQVSPSIKSVDHSMLADYELDVIDGDCLKENCDVVESSAPRKKVNELTKIKLSSKNEIGGAEFKQIKYKRLGARSIALCKMAPSTTGIMPQNNNDFNTEGYDKIYPNEFIKTTTENLSTFSIDVDTASYANIRRFINNGNLPPAGAVRIEEMVNYFNYDYPAPTDSKPFNVITGVSTCNWNKQHKLVRIGIKGKKFDIENRKPINLVFLLDVSGSMSAPNKLPLLKKSLKLLVNNLNENDKISIVVYAGASGVVLPATSCDKKEEINEALKRLSSGGSTNGGAGIKLAYRIAATNFIEGGVNRIILATDGDFNIGVSNKSDLISMIEKYRESDINLTVLGFGMGNYKDDMLEKLADKGNGNYAYIDNIDEAKKVLVSEIGGTLYTIAKDLKIQVDFNPNLVSAYRLIGYENRKMDNQDFNNDKKDAGEIGAGHTVTALYEIIPAGVNDENVADVEPSKYLKRERNNSNDELLEVRIRYKEPTGDVSKLIKFPLLNKDNNDMDNELKFATAVAAFGMKLRHSKFLPNDFGYDKIIELAKLGANNNKYRLEFIELVKKVKRLELFENKTR
jgi:Ca-activated chloride channel family protein